MLELSRNDAVELRFHSENESTERWSELTSTGHGPVALTCSGLGSTSTESFRLRRNPLRHGRSTLCVLVLAGVLTGWRGLAPIAGAADPRPPTLKVPGPVANAPVNAQAYQKLLCVDRQRGDDIKGDGSTSRPLRSLTFALEAAGRPSANSRVAVLLSQGSYEEPTLALKPRVDLYGGFSATGGERDIHRYRTVLDGAGQNRIAFGA